MEQIESKFEEATVIHDDDSGSEEECEWKKRNKLLPNERIVYMMSWYESNRHSKSHTDMYFLNEKDTRWGHKRNICKIFVICVDKDNYSYVSAVENSQKHN